MKIRKNAIRRGLSVSLLCLLLLSAILLPTAVAADGEADALHYGLAGGNGQPTLSGAELLSKLYGITPTQAETEYLERLGAFTFTYRDTVPSEGVSHTYNGEAGTLDLFAKPYRYTAANGSLVAWTPVSAAIRSAEDGEAEQTVLLTAEGEGYRGRFTDLFHSEDFEILVHYEWTVEIPDAAVASLPNAAFAAGEVALQTILEYESALSLYESRLAKHQSYLAHLEQTKAYDAYLSAKKTYDDDKARYDAYVLEYNAYAEELACYEEWAAYEAARESYASYLAKYETPGSDGKTLLEKWQAYAKDLEKVKGMLAPMELLFVSDSRSWQVYASTMGGTVTNVLLTFRDQLAAYEDEIKAVASAEVRERLNSDLNDAETATYALRPLLSAYADLRQADYATEHDRYRALYSFYSANYTALKENFHKLRAALHGIRNNSVFNFGLTVKPEYQAKVPHLEQYIAQLYVIETCLDDAVSQNVSWTVFKDKTNTSVSNLLESVHMLADTHAADPTSAVAPTLPEKAPEYAEKREKPIAPTCERVTVKPTAPTPVVTEPETPVAVEKPPYYDADVERPDWWEAEHPGEKPSEPSVDPLMRALAEEIRAGTLQERTVGAPRAMTLKSTVLCPISIENLMTVSFYNLDGSLLYRTEVEYGSEVIYRGAKPTVADTAQYFYDFLCWTYADGSDADLFFIKANTSFYATYQKTLREYDVTWIVDDRTYTTTHFYGELPTSPVTPYREQTKECIYTFAGWDRDVTSVTGDATYTATFSKTLLEYTVTWVVGTETVEQTYFYGDTPVFEGEPAIPADAFYYTFLSWDHPIEKVKGDARYEARFTRTPLTASDSDLEPVEIEYGDGSMALSLPDGGRTALRFDEAVRLALEEERTLTLIAERFSVTFSLDALEAISDSVCKKVRIGESALDRGSLYTLQFLTSAGRVLEESELSVAGTVHFRPVGDLSCEIRQGEDAWGAIHGEGAFSGSLVLRIREAYAISVGETENCYTHKLPTLAAAGEVIDLGLLTCDPGYEITGATVTAADGSTVPLDALSFVMPEGAVTVTLTVEPIVYHVTFLVNGEIWNEADYLYGEAILLPAIPGLPDDDTYRYVFIGWSPTVPETVMGGNRDPIYIANFSAVLLKTEDPYREGFFDNIFVVLGLYALAFLLLVAAVILAIRFRKRIAGLLRRLREQIASKRSAPAPTPSPSEPARKRLPWETEEEFLQAVEQEKAEAQAKAEAAALEKETESTPEGTASSEANTGHSLETTDCSEKAEEKALNESEAGEPASEDASANAEGEDPKREA